MQSPQPPRLYSQVQCATQKSRQPGPRRPLCLCIRTAGGRACSASGCGVYSAGWAMEPRRSRRTILRGWPLWGPSKIPRAMSACSTWTECSDPASDVIWIPAVRTIWPTSWSTTSGVWTCSTSPLCWPSSHCWMMMDGGSSSNGSWPIPVGSWTPRGRPAPEALTHSCSNCFARMAFGKHLRPYKLRPSSRLRRRFLRPGRRRARTSFLHLSGRLATAVQSLFVQSFCIAFDFAQSAWPTARSSQGGRPGPKSRNRSLANPTSWRIGVLLLYQQLCQVIAMPAPVDTRVGGNSHLKPPGALHTAHPHVVSVANHNGVFPYSNRHPKPARKRAFLRACARASQHGSTIYQGSVAVQETHWRGPLEYTTTRFTALHSGASRPEGGLLLLVSKSLLPAAQIQYNEVIPGRLLHARLELDPATQHPNVDVVVCYQHAWSLPKQCASREQHRDKVLAHRAELWTRLSTLVAALPIRNQLLILGDLNVDLVPEGSLVGRGTFQRRTGHAGDSSIMQDIIRTHDLIALNTWGPQGKRSCTFLPAGPTGHSQIDFAIARRGQADPVSRTVAPKALPFVPVTGMRHLPLLGSIPFPTRPTRARSSSGLQWHKVQQVCEQHPEVESAFRVELQRAMQAQPHLHTDSLFCAAWHQATRHLPDLKRPNTPEHRCQSVTELWRLRAVVKRSRLQPCITLRDFVRRWKELSALQKHQRELRRHCQQLRRQRLSRRLQEAVTCQGYIGIYRVLSLFSPKQPRRKLQLKAPNGMPLDIASTVQTIRDYYQVLYHKHQPVWSDGDGPPFQISWAQLHSALASLPRNKALPPGVAPSRLWGIAADPLTDKYLPALNGWLADMSVPPPEEWHVADLCLIPKPSKPLTGPEALRPISLIHPISKALSIILNNRIKPQLWHLVADLPQMAYLESRSVQDALDRASAHCARVRAVLRAQRQNIHLRKQGHRQAECKGGVLLSIDLRQAFDVMPRPRLKEAMDLAQVDPAAQHVILQLHAHACLRIKHGNQTASLDTANGVRQGCCLAPSLWVLYTGLILTYIRKHVDMADATVFADDFLFHWMVDGAAQLEQVLKHIAFVLETLESFGMSISPGKSAVLIGLRGSKAGTALRKHVIREPRKGKQLHCRTSNGLVRLPVVPSHPYLGAILSYQSMEALTLKERMRQSWSSFHRILPALRSNSVALRHRVLVWQSCVQSTLMHGLDSVGLAPGGSTLLHKHVVRQLRLVSKAPSYITHEAPAALLTRLRVVDPTETLRLRVQRRIQNCREGRMASLQPKPVHQWWQQLEDNLSTAAADPQQIQHQHPMSVPTRLVAIAQPIKPVPCPTCGLYFPTCP